jgi:hypothetical protein
MAGTRKGIYKVLNGSKYNESLVQRGSVTFWFSEEVLRQWRHPNTQPKAGHPFVYSDTAIESLLVLRELFQLAYRQTEGLGRSLAQLMGAHIPIPDYTTLAKRAAKLPVSRDVRRPAGAIDVVVDSTGLKVFGEGEWKVRQHGPGKRRTWRKLHLAVNPDTQEIEAETLTENTCDDASQVDPLLDQVRKPLRRFYGDGAYDKRKVYEALERRGMQAIIPPRRDAKIWQHGNARGRPLMRDMALRAIRCSGRRRWKESVGYHRRSLSQTAMHRMNAVLATIGKTGCLPINTSRPGCEAASLTRLPLSDFLSLSGVSQ